MITFSCQVNVVITLGATTAVLNDVIRHTIVANRIRKRFSKTAESNEITILVASHTFVILA